MDTIDPGSFGSPGSGPPQGAQHAQGPPGRSQGDLRGPRDARRPAAPPRPVDRASAPDPGPLRPSVPSATSPRWPTRCGWRWPRSTRSRTFYAHFDVVRDGETPPPPLTVRVCDSLTCALHGSEALLAELRKHPRVGRPGRARALRRPLRRGPDRRGRAQLRGRRDGRKPWRPPWPRRRPTRSCRPIAAMTPMSPMAATPCSTASAPAASAVTSLVAWRWMPQACAASAAPASRPAGSGRPSCPIPGRG